VPPLLDHAQTADFCAWLRLKNVAAGTLRQYRAALDDYFGALPAEVMAPSQATAAQLRQYVASLQARGLAAKTVNDRVLILKRFYGFLAAEGYVALDPAQRLPTPKVGKRLPKALSLAETRTLLAVVAADDTPRGRRDQALCLLLYGGGLRVSEAVAVRVADIDLAQGAVRVIGKGDRERRVYLPSAAIAFLRDYCAGLGVQDYLFPGDAGGHLTPRTVGYRIQHYAAQAGLQRHVTPHTLRHSIAVHYLQGGAPVSFVQALLGHASLATTGIYLQLTDQMAQEIARRTATALADLAPPPEALREARPVYAAAGDWDGYVTDVLGWLAD
jgi:integrase/recombinase XerD